MAEDPSTATELSETLAREIADAVPHVLWTHDGNGTATYFNRRWTEYTGLSLEDTLKAGVHSFVHPNDRARVVTELMEARAAGRPIAVTYRLRDRHGAYRLHEARVVPVRGEGAKVTLWVGTATDIEERERSNEEHRYLAQASTILGASLELEKTLTDVARMLVPKLADWCAIDLLTEEGKLERAAVEHIDPAKVELAWRLWKLVPPDPASPTGAFAVMRSRQPELVEVTDEMLVAALSGELLEVFRGLGLRSSICVPLIARDRVLGALSLVTAESGTVYKPRDVEFAKEVASRIAVAIDNARLYEAATHARNVAEAMAADVTEQSKAVEAELLKIRAERDAARTELLALQRATGQRLA